MKLYFLLHSDMAVRYFSAIYYRIGLLTMGGRQAALSGFRDQGMSGQRSVFWESGAQGLEKIQMNRPLTKTG